MGERIDALWDRLAELQHRYGGRIALVGLAIVALSASPILSLDIDTHWTALLPEHADSVADYAEARERIGDLRTLVVAIESPEADLEALQRAARVVHERLERSSSEHIGEIESNVREQREFIDAHRHLYVDVGELRAIRHSAEEAIHSGEGAERLLERTRAMLGTAQSELARYPGGFFISEDRTLAAIFVRAEGAIEESDDAFGRRPLLNDVQEIVDAIPAEEIGDGLTISFAGDVMLEIEEKEAVARELFVATGVTVVFVSMALLFFFGRMRAIVLLGMALLPPVALTFAFADLMVESLNTSTAFLASIVIGNGVNPNIMWLSGYFEHRRGGGDVLGSIRATQRSVWIGTLTASLAASLAYASLVLTDFRGFRDFGVIGAFGMAACWIGSGVLLPAWIVLFERAQPLKFGFDASAGKSFISVASARLVRGRPFTVLACSLVATLACLGFVGSALTDETLEYDFQRLTSDRSDDGTLALDERVQAIMETRGAVTLAAPSNERANEIEQALEARARAEGRDALWQPRVLSLRDFVPPDQEEKDVLWNELRDVLGDLSERSGSQAALEAVLPPEDLDRIDIDALPERIARPFTERDGTRGRLLRVDATRPLQDGRYLMAWSKAQREVVGDEVLIASLGTVFADVVEATLRDGPRAMALALLATVLICLFAFPTLRARLLTVLSLLLGVLWMAGTLAAMGFKLNFLNFVAFPITFGNGADYGLNVMRRFEQERSREASDAVFKAIERTGGAVSLCSLTTIIGYSSLYMSANFAIKSFGLAMAVSEITCLLAAVLTMPAVLVLLTRKSP